MQSGSYWPLSSRPTCWGSRGCDPSARRAAVNRIRNALMRDSGRKTRGPFVESAASATPARMTQTGRPQAVLVAVKLPHVDQLEFESSLGELERLVTTLGYEVVAQVTQVRNA